MSVEFCESDSSASGRIGLLELDGKSDSRLTIAVCSWSGGSMLDDAGTNGGSAGREHSGELQGFAGLGNSTGWFLLCSCRPLTT